MLGSGRLNDVSSSSVSGVCAVGANPEKVEVEDLERAHPLPELTSAEELVVAHRHGCFCV